MAASCRVRLIPFIANSWQGRERSFAKRREFPPSPTPARIRLQPEMYPRNRCCREASPSLMSNLQNGGKNLHGRLGLPWLCRIHGPRLRLAPFVYNQPRAANLSTCELPFLALLAFSAKPSCRIGRAILPAIKMATRSLAWARKTPTFAMPPRFCKRSTAPAPTGSCYPPLTPTSTGAKAIAGLRSMSIATARPTSRDPPNKMARVFCM